MRHSSFRDRVTRWVGWMFEAGSNDGVSNVGDEMYCENEKEDGKSSIVIDRWCSEGCERGLQHGVSKSGGKSPIVIISLHT
jgi:hypothetical protein